MLISVPSEMQSFTDVSRELLIRHTNQCLVVNELSGLVIQMENKYCEMCHLYSQCEVNFLSS